MVGRRLKTQLRLPFHERAGASLFKTLTSGQTASIGSLKGLPLIGIHKAYSRLRHAPDDSDKR